MARQGNQPKNTPPTETRIALHVQAGARTNQVVGLADGVLRVRVAAPAREGRANEALVDLLASVLGVPKTRIRIVQGLTARNKVVAVQGLSQEVVMERLLAR